MAWEKKKGPPIKLLYHVYLQAILQQECIEGECFHKCLSQGVAHNLCDVKAHSYRLVQEGAIGTKNPLLAWKTSLKDGGELL